MNVINSMRNKKGRRNGRSRRACLGLLFSAQSSALAILLDDATQLARRHRRSRRRRRGRPTAGMQHVFPIWAGVFPEADEAIAVIGFWARGRNV